MKHQHGADEAAGRCVIWTKPEPSALSDSLANESEGKRARSTHAVAMSKREVRRRFSGDADLVLRRAMRVLEIGSSCGRDEVPQEQTRAECA